MGTRTRGKCAKCGGEELKLFPDEFQSSKWPFTLISMEMRLAGGPDPSRPILVCMKCGHNEDISRRDL